VAVETLGLNPANYSTFYGGADSDQVSDNEGTFHGGDGEDMVTSHNIGTFEQ
jgi:hypothetical protein